MVPRSWGSDEVLCASTGPAIMADTASAIAEVLTNFIHFSQVLIGDEWPGDWLRRSPLPDHSIAGTGCRCEQRGRDANRAVWSSCRDFKVISRSLGHVLSQFAAARFCRRRLSRKFREMTL